MTINFRNMFQQRLQATTSMIAKVQMCIAFTSSSSRSAEVIIAEKAIEIDNKPFAFRLHFIIHSAFDVKAF